MREITRKYRDWAGAKWWRCDLHTHTPASLDYGNGPDKEDIIKITPRGWLLQYMRAEIDCVAITDHNSGEWISRVQDAYQLLQLEGTPEFREMCILPGVEISADGIHILGIFGQDKGSTIIHQLFGEIDYSDSIGDHNGRTLKSINDVCNAIASLGGISLLAHVDLPKGLFHHLEYNQVIDAPSLVKLLNNPNIRAIDVRDSTFNKPPLYYENTFSFPEILSSDSHNPYGNLEQRGPGSFYTWIKMGNTPSFEGLCLALLDGNESIKRSDSIQSDPNLHTQNYIYSITVKDAKNIGRNSSLTITLNPWLNTIIGGRGTGKSSIIEFLRLVMRREDEIKQLNEILQTQKKYSSVYKSRDEDGLLLENSLLSVQFNKDQYSYCIQWNNEGSVPSIQEISDDGTFVISEGIIPERFPVRICSQKQIFEMAKNPQSILDIIDNAQDSGIPKINEKIEYEKTRYLSLQSSLREIHIQIKDESKIRGELDDISKRIEQFEKSGYADILKKYQNGQRILRELSTWEESWCNSLDMLNNAAERILPSDFIQSDGISPDFIPGINVATKQMEEISEFIKHCAHNIDTIRTEWEKVKEESKTLTEIKASEDEYHRLISELEDSGVTNPSEYSSLIQKKYYLEQSLQDITTRKTTYEVIKEEAKSCLNNLYIIRKNLTKLRTSFAELVLGNNPVVRVIISPYNDRKSVDSQFREILGIEPEKFERDIGSINDKTGLLGELYPENSKNSNFAQLEEHVIRELGKIKQEIRLTYEGKDSLVFGVLFQKRILKVSPEQIDRLDCWFPEDGIEIEYRTNTQEEFRSIRKGSPGQMTAALLAFFLSYGNEPLILDQPEDDLDNQLIYTLIVSQLKERKNNRQIIIVTHNPNIVVNGDAELVVALEINGRGQTTPLCNDSLQNQKVRDAICTIMEGGNEALEKRYRRLTAGDHHV